MAISWQTGEPPCGQELLIEFNVLDSCVPRKIIGKLRGPWLESTVHHDPQVVWHVDDLRFLRWSTLDDAPDLMGRLERFIDRTNGHTVIVDRIGGRTYRARTAERDSEGATLAEAVEKLVGGDNGHESD
jgi:hypothetical protein